ncbi:MAG TPA: trypsin-like peptidase domain-containing protein [Candidatus Caenarcaniphilales bacterium]
MATSSSERASALLALSNDLADAVDRAGRAVVAVNGRQRQTSSGVHWQPGVVVTAEHTVKRDEELSVTLPDHQIISASLVGRDPSTDLAVLKLQGVEFPTADIPETSLLQVGHIVLALGRSGESGLSASWGVISTLSSAWRTGYGGQIDQLVRPDLTLYSGFSGGPLVDAQGQVVGINTSGPRRSVLTIPVSTVNRVVAQLLEKGCITRGYLGISMQPVRLPEALTSMLNLAGSGGVIVVNVEPGGPTEQAGVLIGDVLVALDGMPVSDASDVLALLGFERVGKTISAHIIRGGVPTELAITVGERLRGER